MSAAAVLVNIAVGSVEIARMYFDELLMTVLKYVLVPSFFTTPFNFDMNSYFSST